MEELLHYGRVQSQQLTDQRGGADSSAFSPSLSLRCHFLYVLCQQLVLLFIKVPNDGLLLEEIITELLTEPKSQHVVSEGPQLPEGNVLIDFGAVVSLLLAHVTPLLSGGWRPLPSLTVDSVKERCVPKPQCMPDGLLLQVGVKVHLVFFLFLWGP